MANLRKCTERAMVNAGDLATMAEPLFLARISGAVNLLYQSDHNQSTEINGYTNRQVATARLILRCLTYLAKTDARIDADRLVDAVSRLNKIY